MAKYHPPKKPRQYKTVVKKRLRPVVGFFKKRKLLTAIIVVLVIAIAIGASLWVISPSPKKPVKTVENSNPFDKLPGAGKTEQQVKQSTLVGKDRKLLELSIGFNYLYEKNYPKAETIGRQFLDDPEVKQKAQCLLASIYQRGNVQSLKSFEELCKE